MEKNIINMFKKNYNKKELVPVILELVSERKGLTTSSSYCNEDLVEFHEGENDADWIVTEITDIENDGTYLFVEFTQTFHSECEDFECEIYKYETIQLLTDIEKQLKN